MSGLSLLDGSTFKPEQASGQILVMQKLWLTHKDRGLQMLALSVDGKPADAVAYFHNKGYTFPAGWVTPEVQRVLPKPRGLPVTLVRSRTGLVLQGRTRPNVC